jgi:hypothetical protein
MSFYRRLVLFILIMAGLILLFGLFPVVASSATGDPGPTDQDVNQSLELPTVTFQNGIYLNDFFRTT